MRKQPEIAISHSLLSSYIDYSKADETYFNYYQNSEQASEEHHRNFIDEKLIDFLQKYFKVEITEFEGKPVVPRDDFKMRFGNWFEETVIKRTNIDNLVFDDKIVIISKSLIPAVSNIITDILEFEYQKQITTPDFQNFKGFIDFYDKDLIVDIKTTWKFNKQTYIDSLQVPLYQRICNVEKGCYIVFEAKENSGGVIEIIDCQILYTDKMPEWKYRELQVIADTMINNYDVFKEILETKCKYNLI